MARKMVAKNRRIVKTVARVPVFCFALIACAAHAGTVVPQPRAGDPLPDLTAAELNRFNLGKVQFEHTFTAPEGLGPIFNKASCGNCHSSRVGGTGTQTVTRFGRTIKGVFDPLAELGGSLLQVNAISEECLEFVPDEAEIEVERVTNGALAFGLVEAIPGSAIEAVQAAQPPYNPPTELGERGRIHYVEPFEFPGETHVGRFGWKSQVATVLTFSADAAQNELGLSNHFLPFDNAPNGNMDLLDACDTVADPEDTGFGTGTSFIERVTDFQRFLAQPPQTPKSGMTGEALFNQAGCAVCHTPSFTTSNTVAEAALQNKTIRPYSDFLLHYMGANGDPIVQGVGEDGWIKTQPLWNIRMRAALWHDARVIDGTLDARINAAIGLHNTLNSQGVTAAQNYAAFTPLEKSAVVAFMNSLGRREFQLDETDGQDIITMADFVALADCYTGSGNPYAKSDPMDHPCAVADIDQDSDIDLDDFGSFMLVYTGPRRDCNGNGIVDLQDILTGVAVDADSDGLPDGCEPTCNQDINGTGTVNVDDLLAVINQWGNCPATPAPCGADINLDNAVNVDDLLAVINAWGTCP